MLNNNIKVTVAYEKPTTSKFDALMAEYEAAKKCANETVAYYKPLADAAEDAKFDAIMEQLQVIIGYAKQLYDIDSSSSSGCIVVRAYVGGKGSQFDIAYHPDRPIAIRWDGANFTKECMHRNPDWFCKGSYNIIGEWDEWNVYQKLENDALKQIQRYIDKQTDRGQNQINRFNNIVK